MNIFFREFKANLKSLIIWSIILLLFNFVGFQKFSAYYNNPEMLAILDTMPPALLAAMSANAFNLTSVTGFFGIMAVYFGLILSLAAVMWGTGVISKEERDKTVEFSLTLPVTRGAVVTAKTAAMVVDCIILLLITWGGTIASSQSYHPDSGYNKFVALGMLSFFIMQMIFLAVGIFLGCAMKKHKQASAVGIWLLLGTYFLSVMISMNSDLDKIKFLSPFKYFDAGQLLRDSKLEMPYVILSLGVVIVLIAAAYFTYSKRDLYI